MSNQSTNEVVNLHWTVKGSSLKNLLVSVIGCLWGGLVKTDSELR